MELTKSTPSIVFRVTKRMIAKQWIGAPEARDAASGRAGRVPSGVSDSRSERLSGAVRA